MDLFLFLLLLGAAASMVHDATTEKTDSPAAVVTVWPPGSNLHQGETVVLRCSVQSGSGSVGTYRWFKDAPRNRLTPGLRISARGDSLSIRGVSGRDRGRYWCRAEVREMNGTEGTRSQSVDLKVRDSPGPRLTLTPDSSQVFSGESFSFHCPKSSSVSSNWRLRHFSWPTGVTSLDLNSDLCPSLGGVTSEGNSGCTFLAANISGGLYWCESLEDRTNTVNITVSSASVIIRTPVSPVPEGHRVSLYCQHRTESPAHTSFYKAGEMIQTATTTNKTAIMIINNVTQADEGFYKCKAKDRSTESEESWLSVRADQGTFTAADGAADVINGQGWWIVVSCGIILLLLVPVGAWLMWRNKNKAQSPHTRPPRGTRSDPAADVPVTKQDNTEVQWDLSWMEMTNLLDKHLYS